MKNSTVLDTTFTIFLSLVQLMNRELLLIQQMIRNTGHKFNAESVPVCTQMSYTSLHKICHFKSDLVGHVTLTSFSPYCQTSSFFHGYDFDCVLLVETWTFSLIFWFVHTAHVSVHERLVSDA